MMSLETHIKNRVVSDDSFCLWYLGQEGFLFKSKDSIIVIDPYLSNSIDKDNPHDLGFVRNYPSPISPEKLKNVGVDLVLCTHDHQDHLDHETIIGISKDNQHTYFGCPKPVKDKLEKALVNKSRILCLEDNKTVNFNSIKITPIGALHGESYIENQWNSLSYIIEFNNGLTFFHGGDLLIREGLIDIVKEYKPNIVMMPINGRTYNREKNNIIGNTGFKEAVDFANAVSAKMVIPMHFDLYKANDENPAYFVDYIYKTYKDMAFHVFIPSECMELNANDWR